MPLQTKDLNWILINIMLQINYLTLESSKILLVCQCCQILPNMYMCTYMSLFKKTMIKSVCITGFTNM